MSEAEIARRLDKLSDQLENGVKQGVDRLVGTRWIDGISKWVVTVAAGLMTIGVAALFTVLWNGAIADAKASGEIKAEITGLRGEVYLLANRLEGASDLTGQSIASALKRIEKLEAQRESDAVRIRTLERMVPDRPGGH